MVSWGAPGTEQRTCRQLVSGGHLRGLKNPLLPTERMCGPSSEQVLGVGSAWLTCPSTGKPSCTLVPLPKGSASCQKILAPLENRRQRTLDNFPKVPSCDSSSRAPAKTASIRPTRISSTFSLWVRDVLCRGRSPCPRMAGLVRLLVSEAQRMLSQFWKAEQEPEAPTFFLEAPQTEKLLEQGEAGGLKYGLGSMQGWRAHMEDAHTAQLQLPGALADWAFFAVYDGHAGSTVAHFCAQHLLEHVLAAQALSGPEEDPEAVKEGMREAFLAIDKRMQTLSQAEAWEHAGSTAVAVLVSPHRFYFINLGDSRALLCRSATVTFYTEDHKPSKPSERTRIENAGGTVMLERVNGSLAVSRALGDFDYKAVAWRGPTEQLVSPEPEVYELERCPAEDEFLVLACDGVWDAFDNTGLCAFVRSRLCLSGDPRDACECVLDASLYKGSRDNMTCIVVCFPAAPGVSQEAWQKEHELNAYLEKRVADIYEELLQQERGPSLVGVFQCLATEVNPSLPPGGGLASKRAVIMEAYNRVKQSHEEQQQLLAPSAASASS